MSSPEGSYLPPSGPPGPPPPGPPGPPPPGQPPYGPPPGREASSGAPALPPTQPAAPLTDSLLSTSLRDGWEAFKREPAILIGLFILKIPVTAFLAAMFAGLMALGGAFSDDHGHPPAIFFWSSLFNVLDNILSLGILYAALLAVRRQSVPFGTFLAGFRKLLPVLIGLVLMHLIVGFGLLFFIVPGLIFLLGFAQWALLVLDRDMSAPEALSRSWALMRGYKAEYFLLWLVLVAINIGGLIPLGFGLVVTIPFTFAVQAAFYDWLVRMKPAALQPSATTSSR